MKMMKHVFQVLALGLALMLTTSLSAQPGPRRGNPDAKPKLTVEERAQKMTDRQKEVLGLNDKQYKQVLEINMAHAKKQEAYRVEAQKEQEKRRANFQAIENSREAEFSKVLNAEQYAKYKENKQQQMDKAKARKEAGPQHRGQGGKKQ